MMNNTEHLFIMSHPELYDMLQNICCGEMCRDCPLVIKEPGRSGYDCMAIEIKHNRAKPEYLEQVWKAYTAKYPSEAARVSDETKEFLGVKSIVHINVTEEDMMDLFS